MVRCRIGTEFSKVNKNAELKTLFSEFPGGRRRVLALALTLNAVAIPVPFHLLTRWLYVAIDMHQVRGIFFFCQ